MNAESPLSSNLNSLTDELREWLCNRYVTAFSSKSVPALLPFYKANTAITFHQLGGDRGGKGGAGKDVTAYTGSTFAALVRGKLPAALMLKVLFKRLAKQDYDHSTMKLLGVRPPRAGAPVFARFVFERFNKKGEMYETSGAVYRLEKNDGKWFITEAWVFDIDDANPRGLDLSDFESA